MDSFWASTKEHILTALKTGENGLTDSQAALLLTEQNKHKKVKSRFARDVIALLSQFKSPLVLLLVAAIVLSALLGENSDVFIILFILLTTGLLSFWQERNAGMAVEKLQSIIRINSRVLRNGAEQNIPSSEVVKGDVVLLKSGDIVPADCYLLEVNELHVNEASLTGESYPVRKQPGVVDATAALSKRDNCVWEGSNIISGTARAVAVHTGGETFFGSIANSISTTTETAFAIGIRNFGIFLVRITVLLALIILVLNVSLHRPVIDSVLFALALAVGMAPELLPAIMTIAMSAGAKRMSDKKVIVKKLALIQNLGEVNLLCTDKTGTITEGVIKIAGSVGTDGKESEKVKQLAFLNAAFESGFPNPIDEAIKAMNGTTTGYTKTGEIPYDFIRKRLSIAVTNGNEATLITKGAVTNVLAVCNKILLPTGETSSNEGRIEQMQQKCMQYGDEGYRVIAVAYKPLKQDYITHSDENEMILAGFILMEDPIKEGIKTAISELNTLGVQIKIITGDNRYVAAHVGKQLNMPRAHVLTGPEIEKLNSESLAVRVKDTDIFAEIEPQQKEMLILALRKSGAVVAYMGDGINDVAAINAADAGISINNAVDVAREAADFVLLEKNLSVLADGISEGRKTFANTLKYILINTGATFGNMFSVAIASLMLPFLPMLPKQILLTNFLTDFPYLTVSSDNVDREQIDRPGRWNLKHIRNFMILFGLHSSIFDVITFVVLFKILRSPEGIFQTGWFYESIMTELFILFIIRTPKPFLRSRPSNSLVWLSILSFALTTALIYIPGAEKLGLHALPIHVFIAIVAIIILYVFTAELLKLFFFKRIRNAHN